MGRDRTASDDSEAAAGEGVAIEWNGVSVTAARSALQVLESKAILEPFRVASTTPGRPARWWVARELADLVGSWAG